MGMVNKIVRLQFRHHAEVFSTRDEAVKYLDHLVDTTMGPSVLGESKMGEPIVVAYKNGDKNSLILAIGKQEGGNVAYQYIDFDRVDESLSDATDKLKATSDLLNKEILDRKSENEELRTSLVSLSGETESIKESLDAEIERSLKVDEDLTARVDGIDETLVSLDGRIDTLEDETIKSITINGVEYEVKNNHAEATITGDDIALAVSYKNPTEADFDDLYLHANEPVSLSIKKLDYRIDKNVKAIADSASKFEQDLKNAEDKAAQSLSEHEKASDERLKALEAKKITSDNLDPIVVTENGSETDLSLKIEDDGILVVKQGVLSTDIKIDLRKDDNGNKLICLLASNGDVISSIKASEFVVNGMIKEVRVEEGANETKYLAIVWNTQTGADNEEITRIALNELFVAYTEGSAINISSGHQISVKLDTSATDAKYISLSENGIALNGISADIKDAKKEAQDSIKDAKSELETTIADNKSAIESALVASENALNQTIAENKAAAEKSVSDAESRMTTAITSATTVAHAELDAAKTELKGEIANVDAKITTVDGKVIAMNEALTATTAVANKAATDIEGLKSDVASNVTKIEVLSTDTEHKFEDVKTWQKDFLDKYFVTSIPITTVTVDDAKKLTLLRKIANVDGESELYASNDTKDMVHEGSTLSELINTMLGTIKSLNEKLLETENTVKELQTKVESLEYNSLTADDIKEVATETKVTKDGKGVIIGFADDAIFGPTND